MHLINLLTNEDSIRVGHDQGSKLAGVNTYPYFNKEAGLPVMLVAPSFSDSRDGVTDVDTLVNIVNILEEW
jgi:hypothetical protein